MKKATTALFVVLMFVFSCTKESVSPDLDSGDNVLKKAKVEKVVTKTLKIHESSGTTFMDAPVPCEDYEICDMCDYGFLYLVQGTGHATHLGAFTVVNYFCLSEFPPMIMRGILTAANGDQIFTHVESVDYTVDPPVYHYAIDGGSGRFEGATGDIYMWGRISDGTFDLVGEGEITY